MTRLLATAWHKKVLLFDLRVHATVTKKLIVTRVDINDMLLFTLLSLSSLNGATGPLYAHVLHTTQTKYGLS